MNIIIDLESQLVVDDFASRNPANPFSVKAQDTPLFAVYFVQRGTTFDLGATPGLRFGLFVAGNPNPLVQCNTFSRFTDTLRRTCYRGYPVFNTTALAAAIGTSGSLSATGEFRYQTSGGTIARTQDVAFTVNRILLSETILDHTTAAFTVPAIGSNVTIAISSTTWLQVGMLLSIGAGAGSYTVVSITDATHFVAQNNGGTGNATSGTSIPSGTTVGIAPSNVISTYPDPSVIEVTPHKGAANGYAGLDASGLVLAADIPVDNQTISVAAGKIGSASILAYVTANFTTPAANATVSVTLNSTANLKASSYVRIPIAGYYIVQSITDSTHAVLTNNGDPFNAASGVTITSGTAVLPAQAAAGGGSPGQSAYTTTLANFTVPSAGLTVSVNMAATSWLGGSGYVVFIQNAGYYAVSSVTDSTHAVLTNLGYAATNATSGTVITSGATVSPGGIKGLDSTVAGSNAYDTTQASFIMPAAAASVSITITNTNWLGVGQEIYVAGAGYFSVASITSPTIFSGTNSNYPGAAAPGSTIASGAKVSPSGVIGPQGAGGAGLNAFTTLTSNFTQPAVNSTVAIVIGTTAWMAVGQGVFVQGGGYYTVSSVADLTHVTITNLGSAGNAAPGATVSGSGTQNVSPAGTPGINGVNAYTSTTTPFTTPAAGSTVTVTVGSAIWASIGQTLFIAGAGYYQVSAILSATQLSMTNLAGYGNVAGGTNVGSGASVSPSGAIGPAGPVGPQGAAGRDGAYSTVYSTNSIQGNGGVASNLQLVGDAAIGTNAYAHYQRDVGGNPLWAPIPVDNTTIQIVGGKLTAVGGGGGGAFDPATGFYFYDDFNSGLATVDPHYNTNLSGGTMTMPGTYGFSNTALKVLGSTELATGTTNSANQGCSIFWGGVTSGNSLPILYGLGAMIWKTRIFLEGTLPTTGISYMFRAGFGQMLGSYYGYANNPIQGFFFEYDPGQNSGQWRVAYATTGTPTYTNTSVAVAGDTAYNLEIDANTAWTSLTFKINGTTVATLSSGFPTNVYGQPVWAIGRGTGSTTSYKAAIDSWMLNYTFTR